MTLPRLCPFVIARPGRPPQIVETPDGLRFFTIARRSDGEELAKPYVTPISLYPFVG